MKRTSRIRAGIALVALAPVFGRGPGHQAAALLPRVVAVGDIHGDGDALAAILKRAGLIDANLRWAGGTATLVQTGDIMDRGPKVRAALDLLMALEEQAAPAGGRVLVLLGNHETMNLMGQVRDVTPAVFDTFSDEQSEKRRERAHVAHAKLCRSRGAATPACRSSREEWLAAHPPGFVEYREAFGPDGRYGRWLRSRPAVAQVGDTIFLHGGIHPDFASSKPDAINKQVQRELKNFDACQRYMIEHGMILPWFTLDEMLDAAEAELRAARTTPIDPYSQSGAAPSAADGDQYHRTLREFLTVGNWLVTNDNGPLWFRGYAMWSPEEGAPKVARVLERYGAEHFVVGHTIPSSMRITPRFGGRVFLIDTGMLSSYYPGGRASALDIQDGKFSAIYIDETVDVYEAKPSLARDPKQLVS